MIDVIRVRQVKVNIKNDNEEYLLNLVRKKLNINRDDIISYVINKKSLDCRFKPDLYYVYEVDVDVLNEDKIRDVFKDNVDILVAPSKKYRYPAKGDLGFQHRPVIVGSGPAGLFCGYLLSLMGYRPIILERGECVEDRIKTVDKFFNGGVLNKESNVQFGEGGAGTFSDGKLNTLTKDKFNRGRYVFDIFVECGANRDILISNMPHIGTDELIGVIRNIRNKIISMGGSFLYNSCLTNINIVSNKIRSIEINNDKIIDTDILVLAIGHSARDTFRMLYEKGIEMESKPFAVGVRVQHNQDMINRSQYGDDYDKSLPSASYKLTYKASNGRGVYSFCMCPGGYVVNASSEEGRLAINGMSYYKRDSNVANSAIVVTVTKDDYGDGVLDGIEFQRKLEEKAYNLGNGDIPVQLLGDYYKNIKSVSFGKILPVFKGNYRFANLNELYPECINNALSESFLDFGRKIKGFDDDDVVIAGIESRTSSPVRIIRNEEFVSNIEGIYPCGEGAGYAGGITTSAIDGIKVAEAIINKYNSNF